MLAPAWASDEDDAKPVAVTEPAAVALLRLAGTKAGDRVVALGPVDSRTWLAAATRAGAKAAHVWPDPSRPDLATASVLALHLPGQAVERLRPVLLQLRPGTRIVSLDAFLGDWKPDGRTFFDVPATEGTRAARQGAYLWRVPANLTGLWCGQSGASGAVLRIDQRFQFVEGTLKTAAREHRFQGRVDATRVSVTQSDGGRLELAQSGDIVRVMAARGHFTAFRGASFARNCCGTCP